MFRQLLMATTVATIAVGGSTACATKKFVRTSVGEVNTKVDSLGRSLEETQERTRQNEAKIGEVDQRAQAGITDAKNAASTANSAAMTADGKAVAADGKAVAAGNKIDALDKTSRRLVYEAVLSEDSGNFKFGKTDLPDEAKAKIDEIINKLKADPKNVYFEIEGYTDNIGSKELNDKLGLERAEQVKRYLYAQHQVPLHKINTISYGSENPVAPNKTSAGRAQNRRVVIKVLT
ncbi:MAG: OmpA family protein [Acidobacteriaceae bacterium]|jgi:outer membrane protein OmpA-like peptidoglycan-associated protein|nr:OmpA family protein [Acidobacteriaceae bacterium]